MYCKQFTGFFVFWLALVLAAPLQAEAERQASGKELSAEQPGDEASDKPRVPTFDIEGDLAGELSVISTRYEDTFAAIGNRDSLGYLELVKANPGVDPWLPGEGTRITVPRHYVLPDVKREGIVINLAEYRLYYFTEKGVQVYPVGVGTEDNPSPLTDAEVTMPLESPAWYPPASIRAEYEAEGDYLPRMIPPGPDNPLGSHALMLSEKGYLIHGTNKLFGVGMQVSHGCFRMYNEDISRFVYQVSKGTPVRVIREPVKIGLKGNEVWMEVHRPHEEYSEQDRTKVWREVSTKLEEFRRKRPGVEVQRMAIELAVDQADGLPRMIGERVTRVANETSETLQNTPDGEDGKEQRLWF
ncbi:L,D-transpeptidase family protein [Marinobacter sp. SS13-12]|uniref:L,D-transpeptidase family protein n=1 Tax=Marinobacter sp. SS13-12 TaxID=3050451 RepID=UPI00255231E0|nr:L,D-transpeptidase family protein [Marinobacter sp. SS13-12]MDK8462373.1 L,D-transpeptidase family protein [Marinobacter sp. SS13-12]